MSVPAENGNDPGGSGGNQNLTTATLDQKNLPTPNSSKKYNVFILTPSQLKEMGLIAKLKNGKPIILHDDVNTSTSKRDDIAVASNMLDIIPQASQSENPSGVTTISIKSQTLKAAIEKAVSRKQKFLQDEVLNAKVRKSNFTNTKYLVIG